MDIRDALLEVHSKSQATKIADYVGDDPARFDELVKLLLDPVTVFRSGRRGTSAIAPKGIQNL